MEQLRTEMKTLINEINEKQLDFVDNAIDILEIIKSQTFDFKIEEKLLNMEKLNKEITLLSENIADKMKNDVLGYGDNLIIKLIKLCKIKNESENKKEKETETNNLVA